MKKYGIYTKSFNSRQSWIFTLYNAQTKVPNLFEIMEICSNICSLQDAPISRPFSWNVSLKHTSNLCRYHIVYFTTSYRYSKQQKYMIKGKTKILLPELHRLWHFSYQTLFMWRKNFNFRIKEFSSGDFVNILINFRVSLRPKHQKRRTTTTNQLLGSASQW